jgi:hypothetical protein
LLVDRGANGGIGGTNARKLHDIANTDVDITGIENHQARDIPLAVVTGIIRTNRGPIIGIFNNYAYIGQGHSIDSSPQLKYSGHEVNDRSIKVGGSQRITTKNGYVVPISISNGLPYISMCPPTNKEMESLPHVIMTSPSPWDPTILDHQIVSDDDDFYDALKDSNVTIHEHADEYGQYRHVFYTEQSLAAHSYLVDDYHLLLSGVAHNSDNPVHLFDDQQLLEYFIFNHTVNKVTPDYDKLRPNFIYKSNDVIKHTFDRSTQMARIPVSTHLCTWYHAPNPAMNIPRRNEDILTDYVYSDVSAIDDGSTGAQVFFGRTTHVGNVYGMKSESHFPNVLQENIQHRGAPNRLISDLNVSTSGIGKQTTQPTPEPSRTLLARRQTHLQRYHGSYRLLRIMLAPRLMLRHIRHESSRQPRP